MYFFPGSNLTGDQVSAAGADGTGRSDVGVDSGFDAGFSAERHPEGRGIGWDETLVHAIRYHVLGFGCKYIHTCWHQRQVNEMTTFVTIIVVDGLSSRLAICLENARERHKFSRQAS